MFCGVICMCILLVFNVTNKNSFPGYYNDIVQSNPWGHVSRNRKMIVRRIATHLTKNRNILVGRIDDTFKSKLAKNLWKKRIQRRKHLKSRKWAFSDGFAPKRPNNFASASPNPMCNGFTATIPNPLSNPYARIWANPSFHRNTLSRMTKNKDCHVGFLGRAICALSCVGPSGSLRPLGETCKSLKA